MIDLSHWNLSIPEGDPVVVITSPRLVAGYRDEYFKPSDDSIRFWTPVTGTTTTGSSYPRTELREAYADGRQRNWKYREGVNQLSAELAVNKVPSAGRIIVGQIHAKDSPAPLLKLSYRLERGVGYLDLTLRDKPGDKSSPVVMTYKSMPLGTTFDYTFKVSSSGQLDVNVAGLHYSDKINSAWADKALYFKAGSYVTDNQGPASEGGTVVFQSLRVSHR